MSIPSLLLIHGAATGAWVWDIWRRRLGALNWQVNVLDLRGHGRSMPTDLSTVTMEDYVADVASVTAQIEAAQGVHPIVGGWSLGGMVAMMYAVQHPETPGLLLFDPMMPAEIWKADIDTVRQYSGPILTQAVFDIDPDDPERTRSTLFDLTDEEREAYLANVSGAEESGIAFRQTLRGISVPSTSVSGPTLIVSAGGDAAGSDGNRKLAEHLGAEVLDVPGASHWGIVCHGSSVAGAVPRVDRWLHGVVNPARDSSESGEGDR